MNKILKGLTISAVAMGMTACSADYLNEPPIDSITDEQLGESLEGMKAAMNGVAQTMYILYNPNATERYGNGEGYFQTYYGDSPSPDYANMWLWGSQAQYQPWTFMTRDTDSGGSYAWMYAYTLINQANIILQKIDGVAAEQSEKDNIKAQALTIRAHAYVRLMQVYGPRFEDRKNGDELTVVLRLTPGSDPMPLSDYKTVVGQIYKDLDDAIALFESSGITRVKGEGWLPNIDVARGIYSRIALINHDWAKAQQMAHDGRQNYPIMSADEYVAGFADPNDEWMWFNNRDRSNNGYYSWGASFSCNGGYSTNYNWAGSGGQMSWRLYKQVYDKYPDADVRCDLYWMPDKVNWFADYGFTEADFWDNTIVAPAYLNMWLVDPYMTAAISMWTASMTPEGYSGAFNIWLGFSPNMSDAVIQQYFGILKQNGFQDRVQFGAQLKFWSSKPDLGDSNHAFMRASELLLNEAEAALEQGDETTARECLKELNSNRISGYTCTATGDALKEELRLYRRMELWGEGDTWFSFKRWNITATRDAWKAGDPTSGNFKDAYKGSWDPSYGNGWRYQIPRAEKDYNPYINSQLNQ